MNGKAALAAVARVFVCIAAFISFVGSFDTLNAISNVSSAYVSIFMCMFFADFTIGGAMVLVSIMGLVHLLKKDKKGLSPRAETGFLCLFSLLEIIAGLLTVWLIQILNRENHTNISPTAETIMLIIFGAVGMVCSFASKAQLITRPNNAKIFGIVAGACVLIMCILVLAQGSSLSTNSSKATYVLLLIGDLLSVAYLVVFANDAPVQTSNGGQGPVDYTHVPKGHAYTPDEYYEKTGIKSNHHEENE